MDVRELIRDDDAGAGYNEVRGIGWLRARVLLESKARVGGMRSVFVRRSGTTVGV
jgi:hypothetical protein